MKKSGWSRKLLLGATAAVLMLSAGDSALTQVVASDIGIDPLEVLSLTISPNVAIIVDTSGSMGGPFNSTDGGGNNPALGGDDFSSKMYQAKKALRTVIAANAGIANFGLLSYAVRNATKDISSQESNNTYYNGDRYVRYVTDQPSAAFWTGDDNKAGIDTTGDFFRDYVTSNTGTSASDVYGSFAIFGSVLDMGTLGSNCTDVNSCRWFLSSAYVRSNVRYRWTSTSSMTATTIDCSTDANRAPLRLFPDEPHTIDPTKTDYARPCVQMENSSGVVTTFWYTSVAWDNDSQCSGAALISAVPGCMDNDPADVIEQLKLQLPVDGSCRNTAGVATPVGAPCGITPTGAGVAATTIAGTNPAQDPNAMEGLIAGGNTPLRASLEWVNTNRGTVFANQVAGQPNYVILVTDGVDSCSATTAQIAAAAATLYGNGITVFVIAMGIDASTVDAVANAGSGGQHPAYSAQSPQDIVNALNSIINQTAQAGDFSAQPSTSVSVFEFGNSTVFDAADRLDPFEDSLASASYRFRKLVPVTFQPLFEMPGFVGHLNAFIAASADTPVKMWDAGNELCLQITGFPATTTVPARCNVTGAHADAMGNGSFTFTQLTGANSGPPKYTQTSGRLKRRIFTTSRNGVFPYGSSLAADPGQQLVPLWPPTTSSDPRGVDPDYVTSTKIYPNGILDDAIGIATMGLAELQSTFNACRGTPLHAHCTAADAATVLSRARKEARQMILAFAAGAKVANTAGLPSRVASGGSTGELLFQARNWMLADATLSSVVAVTQPLPVAPELFHTDEYLEYMDTYRRVPEPRMSVVYYGANDMLHAFRAGPCMSTSDGCDAAEGGGQELWGFVPFDQLAKLRLLLAEGQDRSNHKYVIASGLRTADVFVPDPDDPDTGEWRSYLFFGRGVAGKHYTALDVTNPGAFTTRALDTTPPLALWNRGNPDTQDGTATGAANYLTNTDQDDLGVTDLDAYATMGQTWSTPALARVRTETDSSDPTPGIELNEGLEFMIYAGSGYSNVAAEGHSFYSINPLTGDIITSADVGASSGSTIPNALVAGVAVFNPGQLVITKAHPANSIGTAVYVGDLHGRLWKFETDDPGTGIELWDLGVRQPIGVPVALHYYDSQYDTPPSNQRKPHIYVTTGNDRRVPTPPAEPRDFLFVGLRDDETTSAPLATELFRFTLPERYRGTSQASTFVTSFDQNATARVLVAVTRYNPVTAVTCRSSFDSRIYLVSAGLGQAAYDVNGDGAIDSSDESWDITGEKVTGVRVTHGQLVVDKGLDPDLDKVPPMKQKPSSSSPDVYASAFNASGSVVCSETR